jgi:hypothetical protein
MQCSCTSIGEFEMAEVDSRDRKLQLHFVREETREEGSTTTDVTAEVDIEKSGRWQSTQPHLPLLRDGG